MTALRRQRKGRSRLAFNLVRALDSAPRWTRRAVDTVTQGRGPIGAIYDRAAHPFTAQDIPTPPPESSAPVRLLIGPANEAEQGYQWARAFERELPGVSAVAMMGIDPAGYGVRSDLRVPTSVYLRSAAWHEAFERYALTCTHVIVESGMSLFGRAYRTDAFAEAQRLTRAGIRVGVMFHGSDLRLPSRHRVESEWSPFRDPRVPSTILEEKALRNIAGVAELELPAFVSTPDLMEYLPGSVWCPVVIEPGEWRNERRPWLDGPPVVLHAPSNSLIKGSERIEPTLRKLQEAGLIEYRQVAGLKHQEMRRQYEKADIVLDQFLIGSYGVAACEALASGCIVVGHVSEPTRAIVVAESGLDLPIVEATVGSLESVLRAIIANPADYDGYMSAGVDFVQRVHSGRLSAEAARGFLGVVPRREARSPRG